MNPRQAHNMKGPVCSGLLNKRLSADKRWLLIFLFIVVKQVIAAQDKPQVHDTTQLADLVVNAFAINLNWKNTPVAIASLDANDMQRVGNTSLVPAMNTIPGVRMEERSPGSYRLSVRGSLLRSPFGIRNIKVYWDGLPLTDAGGNTYLNLVDVNSIQYAELAKGPAASLYGANTGGVLLMEDRIDTTTTANQYYVGLQGGSFNLFKENAGWQHHKAGFQTAIRQSHLQTSGYRQQSAVRRDVVQWNTNVALGSKELLSALLFYTDLHYETPGAITKAQMDSLPTLARQPTSTLPGAVQQNTGVYNKTAFAGFNLRSFISSKTDNITSLVLHHTAFDNPFITNYEMRRELNYGGRTMFDYHLQSRNSAFHFQNGMEWLQNHSKINVHGNKAGIKDTLQYSDDLFATQYNIFSQFVAEVKDKWVIQAGLSANQQRLKYARIAGVGLSGYQHQDTRLVLAPRLSVLYKVNSNVAAYGIVSRGFSPPTLAEIRPSTGSFYNLQAEYGWNTELGVKGTSWRGRIQYDCSIYAFDLRHAIVRKTDSTGADYFTNAGGTKQHGIECRLKCIVINSPSGTIRRLTLAHSFSYQPYTFSGYIVGTKDLSGNDVTGVPKNINVSALDIDTKWKLYAHVNFNAVSVIPLNDANDVFAGNYQLLQAKTGYMIKGKHVMVDIYAGVDNALNQVYSLGNDINALGGRYYNPAPERNYFAGCVFTF